MGIDVHEHQEDVNRLVGFMPDFPPVYEDLLVWEFLDLFAASYRIHRSARPELVDRYLEIVGLAEKRNAPVVELSRGMRQRLMLAKTLIPEPQVLLLDEPASGVDPQGRIDLKNILKRLSAEGKTILISSHILAEMNEFCTSVAIMEQGRLVVSGRIDEVNARIMGDASLAVEVLGDPETFLRLIAEDERAGPVERKGTAPGVPVPGRRGGGQRAAGPAGERGRAGGLVRAAERQPRRALPQGRRQGAVVMSRDWVADWLDNPIFIKHFRSRLRAQPLASAIVITLVLCLLHRLGRVPARRVPERRYVRHVPGAPGRDPGDHGGLAGRLGRGRGEGVGHPRLPSRLAPLAGRARARLLLRRADPRVHPRSPAPCRSRSSAWPSALPISAASSS